jgi:hypothetical protein
MAIQINLGFRLQTDMFHHSHLIERYKTCKDAKEVVAMQELIQAEMEEEGKRQRKERGMFPEGRNICSLNLSSSLGNFVLQRTSEMIC